MGKMGANLMAAVTTALLTVSAAAYTNHTVGGNKGWFFDVVSNTSATNYTSWASDQIFSLGDFLIFNTNTNQTVIQTYNLTTYQNCSVDDASDGETFQYGGGGAIFGEKLTVAVPLTIVGPNYFFSSTGEDGLQCRRGMAFAIAVVQGAGLPPSLNQPPPPPYIEPPGPDTPGGQSPPGTVNAAKPNGAFRVGANVRGWRSIALISLFLLFFPLLLF